tara:strand:+ start:641 stop:1045 length:405 start_codon:yes stop_codon:yes gene_type:complete
MNKVEFSADTGAPRIIIQSNPSWDQWVELCEAVWVTALEGGCNYWMDRIDAGDHDIKDGVTCIKNVPVTVYHNGDIDSESEVTTGKSLDVVVNGINGMSDHMKMLVMNPYTCDIDAEIADQIVQTGLFGSAVYG